MQQILVYGDSLSWGIIPLTRKRLEFGQRWPGVLEHELTAKGQQVRVIEDCLNGRRTVWEDPFKPGRSGYQGLAQCIESHSPLALVLLMLGTNDFQSMHPHNAWHSAQGIARLVTTIREAPVEPGMPVPPVMIVAPPRIGQPRGDIAPKFEGADQKCAGIAGAYRQVSEQLDCLFLDAGDVIAVSDSDGVHLDAAQHRALGSYMANVVMSVLENMTTQAS